MSMHQEIVRALVSTIREKCRMCYTCVRECPAKAICISDGQAEVLPDRCIGCGNCVRVCSQKAKRMLSSKEPVNFLLKYYPRVSAIVAPSFPAEFSDIEPRKLVGMIRRLGFYTVNEVAFGADLVGRAYAELLSRGDGNKYIATSCPAVVAFVQKYHPGSIGHLAPLVSPMTATARVLRRLHGSDLRVVFLGPCLAKKGEARGDYSPQETNEALTFIELREMFEEHGITPENTEPSDFDPPLGGVGMLFPISRGSLQTAAINEDIIEGNVVAVDGHRDAVEAIREFDTGDLDVQLLEVLMCSGCIMGAGTTSGVPLFRRRSRVSRYAQHKLQQMDLEQWRRDMEQFADLSMRREFVHHFYRRNLYSMLYSPLLSDYDKDLRQQFEFDNGSEPKPTGDEITDILHRMGKFKPEDELNCGACGYDSCRDHANAILKGLAETEMCLPFTIDKLRATIQELDLSHKQLAETQQALIQSEKLASMGQLAAGIAHEVNNPLGVVLMYAHILREETPDDSEFSDELKMIVEQANRCKTIVSNLLDFARQNRVALLPIDITQLVESSLRALPPPPGVTVEKQLTIDNPIVEIDKDQIGQVLTNLISNAYAAMETAGGVLTLAIQEEPERIKLRVGDTGIGISKENRRKIFEPFFTTKKMGKGTGLGLAVTYGIIKMHRGDIQVESNDDPAAGPTGTTMTVTLPRQSPQGL